MEVKIDFHARTRGLVVAELLDAGLVVAELLDAGLVVAELLDAGLVVAGSSGLALLILVGQGKRQRSAAGRNHDR
jgi:hypothetical protein